MEIDVDKLLEDANQLFFKNDYERAERIYLEILASDPGHAASLQKLARIALARNQTDEAVDFFKRSLAAAGDDVNTWNDLGNLHYDRKNYLPAIDCYRRAIALQPEFYWAYFNIGLAVRHQWPDDPAKVEEAKTWFDQTLGINPDYYPALNELGLYHLDKNEYEEAARCFDRAIALNPHYKFPYFNMSIIAKKRGDDDAAIAHLQKALECDPRYVPALNKMGIVYFDERRYRKAAFYYSRALEIDPRYVFALYNMGLVFLCFEEYGKARAMFVKTLAVDPGYENATQELYRLDHDFSEEMAGAAPLAESDLAADTYLAAESDTARQEAEDRETGLVKAQPSADAVPRNREIPEVQYYTEKFGRNITRMAREGKLFDVLGREREMRAVLEVLMKIKKNNPIVVGRAGVGKTAVVEGIARQIARGEVPPYFRNKEILEVNMGMLVAGTQFRGDFEKRLGRIVEEVAHNEDIILFIDEIHTVLGAGETIDGSLDAANILKPALARGELHCIGATTTEEYNKHFVKDQAFLRRFYPVHIEELDRPSSLAILRNLRPRVSRHYGLTIDDRLMELIVDLAGEEIKNRVFPDKAIDALENACSRAALDGKKILDDVTVKNVIGEFVGMKFLETDEDQGRRLLQMEAFLKARVYGQDEAVDRTARLVRLTKRKLDLRPEQPDGVLFFSGPTGVGKTWLAKQLAQFLFGAQEKCLVLNMAEFSEPHAVAKLIGSPPGYVGHDDVPFFSRTILEHPSSLLLLDEIEKAHPEVLKLFLEIFEEGRITDTKGREIFFSNVTVIMTSNAGCLDEDGIGFNASGERRPPDLSSFFPAEFVNRIDDIIRFNPIDKDTARRILSELIVGRAIKTFAKKGIELALDPLFVEYVLERGFSRKYGVRNLERTFEKEVLAEVATHLFNHPYSKKIVVSREKGSTAVHEASTGRADSMQTT